MANGKKHARELSLTILKGLALGSFVVAAMAFPGLALLFRQNSRHYKRYSDQSFKKSLWYLKKKGLIKIQKSDKTTKLQITDLGKNRIQQLEYKNLKITPLKQWDQKWRLVIFDIPEKFKLARETFRKKLKNLGFYQLQKSMYIYPFPCKAEIELAISALGIRPFVVYLTASNSELPPRTYKHFKETQVI